MILNFMTEFNVTPSDGNLLYGDPKKLIRFRALPKVVFEFEAIPQKIVIWFWATPKKITA